MPKGVKIEEIEIGTGAVAERHHTVVVNLKVFLSRGEELWSGSHPTYPRQVIDLHKRETIAGVRYGIAGMRVGGKRHFIVSPHLSYGERGIENLIPPNAVLRCEVELLEVRKGGARLPEDFPPGKRLRILHPGEAATDSPRWSFGLFEDGRCGASITRPHPVYGWKHPSSQDVDFQLDPRTADTLLEEARRLPLEHADECLGLHQMWADSSEPGNGISRDIATDTMCIGIGIEEQGVWYCHYSLKHDGPAWTSSMIHRAVSDCLAPHLNAD